MISVLLVSDSPQAPAGLSADLVSAGFHLIGASDWRNLVRDALQHDPALVVVDAPRPDDEVFAALAGLHATHPLPVLLFTQSPDAQRIEQSLAAGVAEHVVDAFAPHRLRPLAHLAIARFRREQALQQRLAELQRRFDERKLVDRAKAVLMRARQIPEDEAFRMLQVASMHTNCRVGQVSQQVIDAARFAEAVNRAGQLRMFSQQLVKLAALRSLSDDPAADTARLADLLQRGRGNLQALRRGLAAATYGDLLDAVELPWQQLEAALQHARPSLPVIDALAEQLLQQAERLTAQLDNAGLAAPLRVINLSGRQRMLSQRLAKQALLARLLPGAEAAAALQQTRDTEAAFEQALAELEAMPLSSQEIRADLAQARDLWAAMLSAVRHAASGGGEAELRTSSDQLLELFERLTRRYEHSLQMLLG
ncbi:type IV pili methyl-accepting chemotaxis transducer N-terminal domain-containing protein [Piscinibacter sakaiensis]|uniref:type IV pili methyl-accepting chemotaxis transducer N-terminal domain-containing protein n=1 Tax=Piscinibacter sakaiensis TaxID=1547922 RepID=UPI003AAB63C8